MSRSKVRFASVAAVVLVALLAVYPYISFPQMEAQEPAKVTGGENKIDDLQKERLVAAREFAKQQMERAKSNVGVVEEVIEATQLLMDAELAVCGSRDERIAVLARVLAAAKDNERIAAGLAKTGQGRETTALKAKLERLRIEIAWERENATKEVPPKGAANPEPAANIRTAQSRKGDASRICTQPADIQPHETVRVFSPVSGFLKKQSVDIGTRVKRGELLAVVEAADIEAQRQYDRAAVNLASLRVQQAKARLVGAEAQSATAKLAVQHAEEGAKSAASFVQYRAKQLSRMEELFRANSIEVRLVDESKAHHEAALGAEQAATTAVAMAKARVAAGMTKIEETEADLAAAEAGVRVAQADLDKAQTQLSRAAIHAPLDGAIVQRGYFPGEFIRSAEKSANDVPLFTVQRTDLMRVIVAIPERDTPFVAIGNAAELEIDALPGQKWSGKVARMAETLDPKTRAMAVEIDLPNPTGQIRPGMYGRATIVLGKWK